MKIFYNFFWIDIFALLSSYVRRRYFGFVIVLFLLEKHLLYILIVLFLLEKHLLYIP